MKKHLFLAAILNGITKSIAGDFVNIDLNHPNLNGPLAPSYPGGPLIGLTTDLIPGWNLTADDVAVTSMGYAPPGVGWSVPATLVASQEGKLTEYRLSLVSLYPSPPDTVTGPVLKLSQTGMIPWDAVDFRLQLSGNVEIFANGVQISGPDLRSRNPSSVDVSAYRGQEVTLDLVVRSGEKPTIKILGFSQVPEPSTTVLLVCSSVALLAFRVAHLGSDRYR